MAERFAGAVTSSGPLRPPERSFLAPKVASQILSMLGEVLPPQAQSVADSVDMQCSPALLETFAGAATIAKELHHGKVEPLHLIAAMLSTESGVGEILTRVGLSRESVVAAIHASTQ